jgi:Sec-independent protein translocase protein TatA
MAFETLITLLGLLERAPEIADSFGRIVETFRRRKELTDEQFQALRDRMEASFGADHWKTDDQL